MDNRAQPEKNPHAQDPALFVDRAILQTLPYNFLFYINMKISYHEEKIDEFVNVFNSRVSNSQKIPGSKK